MGTNFFEFREQVTAPAKRKATAVKPLAVSQTGVESLTVSQLTAKIDHAIRDGVPGPVLVRGEVSNWRPHAASGHLYFSLKDAGACMDCVMWKSDAVRLKFAPGNGME